MKVSVQIQQQVAERGWDIQELARQIEVEMETAEQLYRGQPAEIELGTLGRLSQALGVLPNDIVVAVPEKQPSAADAPPPRDPTVPLQSDDVPPPRDPDEAKASIAPPASDPNRLEV